MPRILVVDDDKDTRAIIKQAMSALSYQVIEAEDGQVAKDICQKELPSAIVLDVMMPRMTGLQFIQWFRDTIETPFVPVLMLTALNQVENKVEGLRAGADDYLSKPFNYRELQARVQSLLRVRALTNDLYIRTCELEEANIALSRMQAELLRKERELVAAQLAGAAAHRFGQSLTSILLHCRLLEKSCTEKQISLDAVQSIRKECEAMNETLGKLKSIDAHAVTEYIGDKKILDIDK